MSIDPTKSDPIHDERTRKVELIISRLLQVGVIASLFLLVAGTTISFAFSGRYGHESSDLKRLITASGEFPFRDPHWLLEGLRHGRGQAMIVLGLVLLILTPTIRVAVSVIAFASERDWIFVGITGVVLALLLASMLLGGAG